MRALRERELLIHRGKQASHGLCTGILRLAFAACTSECETNILLAFSLNNTLCYHNGRKNAILYHFKRPCQ